MNWKTTALGVVSVVAAVSTCAKALLAGAPCDFAVTIAAVTAGLGLIFAADAKKVTG